VGVEDFGRFVGVGVGVAKIILADQWKTRPIKI